MSDKHTKIQSSDKCKPSQWQGNYSTWWVTILEWKYVNGFFILLHYDYFMTDSAGTPEEMCSWKLFWLDALSGKILQIMNPLNCNNSAGVFWH